MSLPGHTLLTVEECRQVAARVALHHGALMTHALVEVIEDVIADVLIADALANRSPFAPKEPHHV